MIITPYRKGWYMSGTGEQYFTGGTKLIEKFANDRHWASASDFARFLTEIEPARSLDAWRNRRRTSRRCHWLSHRSPASWSY